MLPKQTITAQLIDELKNNQHIDSAWAMVHWWQDPRPDSGLRLTQLGHDTMQKVGRQSWSFDVQPYKPNILLMLNRHITQPYFLTMGNIQKKPTVIFYGSREATVFALYGNLQMFAQALKNLA